MKKLIIANWKMNLGVRKSVSMIKELSAKLKKIKSRKYQLVICPSFVALEEVNLAQIGVQSQADYQRTKSIINAAENKKSTGLSAALQIGVAGVSGYASAGGFAGGTGASSGGGLFGSETAFTQGGMSGSVVTPGYFGGAAGTVQGASYVPTRMLNGVPVPR